MKSTVAEIAQLGERQTEDMKVPGSKPESSHKLCIIPGLGSAFFPRIFFSRSGNSGRDNLYIFSGSKRTLSCRHKVVSLGRVHT